MRYTPRIVDRQLNRMLGGTAAVLVNGARGVGKSTTARQVARTVIDLEIPETLSEVIADPNLLRAGTPPVFIDEWQRYPQSMNVVKSEIDKDRTPGRYILAGTPSHPRTRGVHSGAARLALLQMRPFSLVERGIDTPTVSLAALLAGEADEIAGTTNATKRDYAETIVASGFPEISDDPPEFREALIDSYLQLLVRRDISQLINGRQQRISPAAITRWLASYGEAISTDAYFSTIAKHAERQDGEVPSDKTINFYRDAIIDLGVIEPLLAWPEAQHPISDTKGADRHHLVDPSLAAHLCGLYAPSRLLADRTRGIGRETGSPDAQPDAPHSFFGALFESLVTQSVRVYADAAGAKTYWLATTKRAVGGQHEVDLIVQARNTKVLAIEVKLTETPSGRDARHLRWLRGELGTRWADGVIVNTGETAYRRDDGIAVVPAALLGP